MTVLTPIDVDRLVPLNAFAQEYPVKIDVVYAQPDHPDNHFGRIYHPKARVMWADPVLAAITLAASLACQKSYGWLLQIKDSLRPLEAQAIMQKAGFHEMLVSKPGQGGHPRAMAIDIEPVDAAGIKIPMGTPFDFFAPDPVVSNPAARDYANLGQDILRNRKNLEDAMVNAARAAGQPFLPLPQEWWDFRFARDVFLSYAPLSENDLRPWQRMIDPDIKTVDEIISGKYPDTVARAIDFTRSLAADISQKTAAA